MSTMISASIWFSVSSVLSAYYCLDRHPVLKPLVTPRHDENKTVASNLFYVRLSAARNIANVKVHEARVFMLWPKHVVGSFALVLVPMGWTFHRERCLCRLMKFISYLLHLFLFCRVRFSKVMHLLLIRRFCASS